MTGPACAHAASGCNYPEGECAGLCVQRRPGLSVIEQAKSAARELGAFYSGSLPRGFLHASSSDWPCGKWLRVINYGNSYRAWTGCYGASFWPDRAA